MKIISASFHAVIDYLFVLILIIAPMAFHLGDNVSTISYVFAAIHLVLTLLTNNTGGIIKVIPLRIHGVIDFLAGVVFLGLAFWFNSKNDVPGYYYFLVLGLICVIVFFLTNYGEKKNKVTAR